MNAPADALAGILAEHMWHHTATTHCRCGFRTPLAQLALEGYLAHLAAVIQAEYVAEREAKAWNEALKHASRLGVPTPPNPYRKDQETDRG